MHAGMVSDCPESCTGLHAGHTWRHVLLLLMMVSGGTACQTSSEQARLVVYAAASLADVVEMAADSFELAHPDVVVVVNLAATSILARQIEQGAPADIFFSANEANRSSDSFGC